MYSKALPTKRSWAPCISFVWAPARLLMRARTAVPARMLARETSPIGRQARQSIRVMARACAKPPTRNVRASMQLPSKSDMVVVSTVWMVPRLPSVK